LLGSLAAGVVGEAAYGIEASRLAAELQPDVVLLHVEEPLAVALRTLELVQRAAPRATPLVVSRLGDGNLVWASDYPHVDAIFPGAVKQTLELLAPLSAASRARVLGENARRLYGLA